MSSKKTSASTYSLPVPEHIAIIMDGNGRWARQRNRIRAFGHSAGLEAVRKTLEVAVKNKVAYLTLFAFSSENWGRPEDEVSRLMSLFMTALDKEVKSLHQNGVRIRFIGDLSRFTGSMRKKMTKAEALTQENKTLYVNVALNYGGYWDVCQAAQRLASQVKMGHISVDDITPEVMGNCMTLRPDPAPDLLIRSGGEQRLSNFLLWDTAYSELYFTDVLWPDFNEEEFNKALQYYATRQRRFGLTGQQVEGKAEKSA